MIDSDKDAGKISPAIAVRVLEGGVDLVDDPALPPMPSLCHSFLPCADAWRAGKAITVVSPTCRLFVHFRRFIQFPKTFYHQLEFKQMWDCAGFPSRRAAQGQGAGNQGDHFPTDLALEKIVGRRNNTYCQDNELNWFDWNLDEDYDEDWSEPFIRTIGVRLVGDAIDESDDLGQPIVDETFVLLLNASQETVPFCMPSAPQPWGRVFDTPEQVLEGTASSLLEPVAASRMRKTIVYEKRPTATNGWSWSNWPGRKSAQRTPNTRSKQRCDLTATGGGRTGSERTPILEVTLYGTDLICPESARHLGHQKRAILIPRIGMALSLRSGNLGILADLARKHPAELVIQQLGQCGNLRLFPQSK